MKKKGCLGKVLTVILILFIVVFGITLLSDDEPADSVNEVSVEQDDSDENVAAPADSKKDTSAKKEKTVPLEYTNALVKAEIYANDM